MNFKKSKDVKRSSYYVWFLGSKESKGLRGDEYVTPVLNYLLDGECEGNNGGGGGDAQPLVEPSKVTLQVSSKGLKIIQILTVPRKSCQKLSADQQSALFFAKQQQQQSKGGPPFGDSASAAAASSMLKSEQVKHHIPHNSITWVYQEEDVVCAILLLYNPLTRCPVHVHAYRCDSVETADSLRGQLQALVSRPENQKKFRDIESRLRAKGLLLTRSQVNNGQHGINSHSHNSHNNHNSSDRCDNSYNYAEEEELPPLPVAPLGGGGGGPTSKTLKSDGRSTRTEGSDELNSEESNSSDLGYAVCSKNSVHHHQHHNNNNSMMMMMMSVPPMLPAMHHHREHHHQSKLPPSAGKKKHSTQHGNSPSSAAHFKQQQQQHSGKQSKQSRGGKSKPFEEEEGEEEGELAAGATAALYDSLAAELRAKLGNPKMGPLLLPPRDYDGTNNNNNNKGKENVAKRQSTTTMFPLTRSESSGKSSSGIGSEEALSSEINQTTKKLDFYGGRGDCYNDDHEQLDYHHHQQQHSDQPQSFIDYDRHRGGRGSHQKRTSQNRYLFGGSKPEKSQPYSLPMNNAYSSEEEEEENSGDDDDEEGNFDHRRCDHHSLEVDAEDIEEDVLFTANCNRSKSKSTFDLFPQYKFAPENAVALHNSSIHGNGNNFANSFEVAEASKYHHQQQQQQQQQHRRRQQPSYPSFPLEMDHLQFAGERKSRSRHQHQHQQQQQQQQQHMAKMYASNPNLSRNPLKEVKQTSDKSAFVMGRREQRTLHTQQQHQLISGSSPPVGKFSFGAVPTAAVTAVNNGNSQHRQSAKQQQPQPQPQPSSKQPPKFYFADAEFGMDSKMALPFAPFPLGEEEDHFANRSKAKKCAGNLAPSSSRAHHQQLGRSSGNLVALDYSGPTSLANYHFHNGGSAEGGRRSPGHFRAPRQETRYEMPPQPTSSSSSAAKIRGGSSGGGGGAAQQQQYNGQPPLSAYSKNCRSSGNGFQQQQHQHPLGYDHELAMRKKLEQPYSRYSYIDVEHSRAERFHYVPPPPPAAMRR